MNTQYLNYVIEIDKAGSISRAAQNLYMAQPNLSKAVKELEEDIGYSIFERTATGIVTTDKGKLFLSHAKQVIEQLEAMESIGGAPRKNVPALKISIPRGSYIANGCTDFVCELDASRGMDITIQETNSIQAINNVAYEQYNLGVVRYQKIYEKYFLDFIASKQLAYESIWEFSYLVVMAENDPLATKETVLLEDLQGYIEISHADTEVPYIDVRNMDVEQEIREVKNKIYVYERGSQFDLLTHVPSTYMWVSPLPEKYVEKYGLVQRKCEIARNQYKDILVHTADYKFTEADKLFQKKLFASKIEVSTVNYH